MPATNSPEDNLDPIEEEHAQPQNVGKKEEILPDNSCNQKDDEGVGVSEINNAIHATLTAAAASESAETGTGTNGNPQHRWSNNRRSQILKQQSIHQGKFNKSCNIAFSHGKKGPYLSKFSTTK